MRRFIRLLLTLVGFLSATPALAIDASYHTWDGFSETVDAFHLIAMILGSAL
jgi:conjugal transfer mating pair stabilization protein TraG